VRLSIGGFKKKANTDAKQTRSVDHARDDPGARYAKHVDNPDGDGRDGDGRRIALVYYLNDDDWTDDDAGALRLYHPSSDF